MIYYFDTVFGGRRIRDPQGSEFPNLVAAIPDARRRAEKLEAETSRRRKIITLF